MAETGSTKSSGNIAEAVNAAEEFEQKHYQTNSAGEAEELDASDFTRAAKQAGNLISSAAQSATTTVKEAVVGKDGTSPSAAEGSADPAAAKASSPAAPADGDGAAAAEGPSLTEQIQTKTSGALDSLQKAVEPAGDSKSADPEVNEFRSLVGEVFANMKESIATGTTQQEGGDVAPKAPAAADAAHSKSLASSPAEARRPGLVGQIMDKFMPVIEAEGPRSAGESHEGKTKGLLEDLVDNVETAVEEVTGHHQGRLAAQHAGAKWGEAKDEARESGYQAKESAKDAASAVGDEARYGYERVADKTQGFLNRAGGAAVGAAEEVADLTRDAKDRIKRDWPDNAVRGAARETEDLTRDAKNRVQRDWQDTKRGTQRMLDDSSAARQWDAERAPVKEEARGFFGSISHALFGSADKAGDKAQEAADRTRYNARSTADNVSDKAQNAKEEARGFFDKAGDEADRKARAAEDKTRGFFGRASDEAERKADRAEDKTRGFFNRASDEAERKADRAEDEARGFFNSVSDEAQRLGNKASRKVNRLGDRISDTAEDAENAVRNKLDRAENYLTADLRPATSFDAALSNGQIPSNTQDVLAERYGRGRY